MGAAAVSKVQGTDRRVAAVVALDKLTGPSGAGPARRRRQQAGRPGAGVQSEYGFTVSPYLLSGGSSLTPSPSPDGPDPRRERETGYDAWQQAGVDSMLVVPRASTHLEYTDIPLVLPASRYGQALASHYTQAWLDRYLKHRATTPPCGHLVPLPRAGGQRRLVAGHPAACATAELLLLLGLPVPLRHALARATATSRAWVAAVREARGVVLVRLGRPGA